MTITSATLRRIHRVSVVLTVLTVLVLAALRLSGQVSSAQMLRIFVAVEVPMVLLVGALSVIRVRTIMARARRQGRPWREELLAEEPLLRMVFFELAAYRSLWLLLRRRREVAAGAQPMGYTRGTLSIPLAMLVVCVVEMVAVHLIISVTWLALVLLLTSLWAIAFISGLIAMRVVHPHYIYEGKLVLRAGCREVAVIDLDSIAAARAQVNRAHTQPAVVDNLMVLTYFEPPNIRLTLHAPVPADPPVSPKHRPDGYTTDTIDLYVDSPEDFLDMLAAR